MANADCLRKLHSDLNSIFDALRTAITALIKQLPSAPLIGTFPDTITSIFYLITLVETLMAAPVRNASENAQQVITHIESVRSRLITTSTLSPPSTALRTQAQSLLPSLDNLQLKLKSYVDFVSLNEELLTDTLAPAYRSLFPNPDFQTHPCLLAQFSLLQFTLRECFQSILDTLPTFIAHTNAQLFHDHPDWTPLDLLHYQCSPQFQPTLPIDHMLSIFDHYLLQRSCKNIFSTLRLLNRFQHPPHYQHHLLESLLLLKLLRSFLHKDHLPAHLNSFSRHLLPLL